MNSARFDRLGILLLLLGTVPAFAAQERHGGPERQQEERPAARQEPQRQARQERPQQHQEPGRGQQDRPQPHQERPQQRQEPARAQQERPRQPPARGHQPEPQRGHAGGWQDHRASNFQSEHRDWQQRGGYHGYRIPESRFRGRFGEAHRFRMSGYPMRMYRGHPRFQYGGVWLSVLDPWPEFWGANWYADDDMYIGFSDGGYYLYNRSYPGSQIALSVSL